MIHAAVISACRLASISLRSLGLAVATAFLPSTTSLVGSPLASSTPCAFLVGIQVRYYSASSSNILCNTKLCLLPLLPFFIFELPLFYCCVRLRVSKMISSLLLHWAVHKILSLTPSTFPRWDTSTGLLQRKQQSLYNTKFGLLHLLPLYFGG